MELSCDITKPKSILNPETPMFRPGWHATSAVRENIRIVPEIEKEED
jgi:hypothetical protein